MRADHICSRRIAAATVCERQTMHKETLRITRSISTGTATRSKIAASPTHVRCLADMQRRTRDRYGPLFARWRTDHSHTLTKLQRLDKLHQFKRRPSFGEYTVVHYCCGPLTNARGGNFEFDYWCDVVCPMDYPTRPTLTCPEKTLHLSASTCPVAPEFVACLEQHR